MDDCVLPKKLKSFVFIGRFNDTTVDLPRSVIESFESMAEKVHYNVRAGTPRFDNMLESDLIECVACLVVCRNEDINRSILFSSWLAYMNHSSMIRCCYASRSLIREVGIDWIRSVI